MPHIATDGVSSDSVLAGDISCSIPFFQSIRSMQSNLPWLLRGVNVASGIGAGRRIGGLWLMLEAERGLGV